MSLLVDYEYWFVLPHGPKTWGEVWQDTWEQIAVYHRREQRAAGFFPPPLPLFKLNLYVHTPYVPHLSSSHA